MSKPDPDDEDRPMTRAEKRAWQRFLDRPVAHTDYEPLSFVMTMKPEGPVDPLAFNVRPPEPFDLRVEITREDIDDAFRLSFTGAQMLERSVERALAKLEQQ
jgi:hypothetical protein